MRFANRVEAGRLLAQSIRAPGEDEEVLVLGLPRGGVPVAYEVALALGAPLDVWMVRKLGAPGNPELGLGAVAEGEVVFLNPELVAAVGASEAELDALVREKTRELAERARRLRPGRPPPEIEGKTVVLVDDGIATGGTVRTAVQALRKAKAGRIVLAVPVAASQSLEELRPLVDEVICLYATPALWAIGAYYEDFEQVSDEEVSRFLARAQARFARPAPQVAPAHPVEVRIPIEAGRLEGTLTLVPSARGLVLFAHGSGSSRHSPRNRRVAGYLQQAGLSTLLFDLLTEEEERVDQETAELRFDIDLLTRRLVQATDWAAGDSRTAGLRVGYFGSSTGAAAALAAAALRPELVGAVVSRGGRPDLAYDSLVAVQAPTLLIVGGEDDAVIPLNERAFDRLLAPKAMELIPGATHLFEERGALEEVAHLAARWFVRHLARAVAAPRPLDSAH